MSVLTISQTQWTVTYRSFLLSFYVFLCEINLVDWTLLMRVSPLSELHDAACTYLTVQFQSYRTIVDIYLALRRCLLQ